MFSKPVAILMGMVFVNMSFFLAEVKMLKLDDDSRFVQVVLLALTCFEEERETGNELPKEDSASAKKMEITFSYPGARPGDFVLLGEQGLSTADNLKPMGWWHETFTPPPELPFSA